MRISQPHHMRLGIAKQTPKLFVVIREGSEGLPSLFDYKEITETRPFVGCEFVGSLLMGVGALDFSSAIARKLFRRKTCETEDGGNDIMNRQTTPRK